MSNNLTSNNPTSYLGVKATTPPQLIVMKRAPTTQDYIGYPLGTQWLYYIPTTPSATATGTLYSLVSVAQNIGIWEPLNGGDDNPTLPDHSVALGTGVPGLNSTGPATIGTLLMSNGTGADPSFSLNPSPTVGLPIVSQGSGLAPEYGLVTVSGGGTGLDVVSQYTVLTGGSTGEGPLQTVSGLGVATQVLTSNGAGMLPSW